ncbi:hypothetical protein QBC38DRAFT_158660 [Podospora fimiseda]|uniref:Uncharacterized protein n=1 Tax=Podospora fimiseda TaxID=252190 RepID=A0AAN7H3N8_9PEZI|nr:hypothetical protein QBC38DRAFT_158660 [Podospora fimiseda]
MSKTDRDRSVVAHYPSAVSPLRVGKGDGVTAPYPKHVSVLEEYERWRESTTPEVGKNQHQGDGRSASSGSAAPARVPSSALMAEDSVGIDANRHSRTYSPITPLVPVEQLEALRGRVASKTLIGENGWLEDTSKGPNPPSAPPSKGRLFLNRFKSKAKDVMTGGSTSFSVGPSSSTRAGGLLRSLNPREQSLLVCELDFAIASALEAYIESQFVRGRVSLAAIKKIADNWARKGRPKVIGFRYDIETQIEIVKLHINDFKFCGRYATNPVIVGVLDSMRMTARSMAVRTYCYPDTVISMWLTDARKLFELMGTGEREVCGIIGIHAFFSSVVLREQQKAEQSQTLDSVGVQGAGFAELDPLPPLARSKSQPQKREKPEQPAKEEKPQYQKHSQQASYPSQEQPHSQQHQYQERPQEYQYQGHPQQQKFQERSQQHQYHWCQEDENTRPSDALRSEYNSSPLKSPRKTGRKNYGSLEKDEPEYVTSSPAKAYDSTFSHQAYGSTSSRPAYGSASSHQAHGSSAQHSQQGPSNISQPRQKITKITDLAALRSTPRKIADWDYETPYQNLSNIDRSRSSPTKKYSTTTSPTKGFFFTASPTKKEQPDNSHWSSESRSQRRRELLQPIMKKYDSPKEDLPSPKRQANAQAYMDHQASSSSRRLPISTSEKTLKTSHSVQNSLNERELREQREVARERERELYHQQNLMRCARSRFGEEEDDDDDMF